MDAEAKRRVREAIDAESADWTRYGGGAVELAHVDHDGERYVLMRSDRSEPPGIVLVFDTAEWRAFAAGVRDGEFDDLFDAPAR